MIINKVLIKFKEHSWLAVIGRKTEATTGDRTPVGQKDSDDKVQTKVLSTMTICHFQIYESLNCIDEREQP